MMIVEFYSPSATTRALRSARALVKWREKIAPAQLLNV